MSIVYGGCSHLKCGLVYDAVLAAYKENEVYEFGTLDTHASSRDTMTPFSEAAMKVCRTDGEETVFVVVSMSELQWSEIVSKSGFEDALLECMIFSICTLSPLLTPEEDCSKPIIPRAGSPAVT